MNEGLKKKNEVGAEMEPDTSEEVAAGGREGGARLTERDRQLMGLLGLARHLSEAQVAEALFPGLNLQNMRKRLRRLSGEGTLPFPTPYLRRVYYRAIDGNLVPTWTLTKLGYRVAVAVAGQAARMVGKEIDQRFLEHTLTLNSLLVHLAKKGGTGLASARPSGWKWIPGETARLPWHINDVDAGTTRNHLILPDAVLEIADRKKRFFLECEMGTHSIRASSDEKKGSTLAKVERYETYFESFAEFRPGGRRPTFYEKAYPDNWKPEVVFLVRSAVRKANINEAIAKRQPSRSSPCRALTFDEAKQEFGALIHKDAPRSVGSDSALALQAPELELLVSFFSASITTLHAVRARHRSLQIELPPYPAESSEVKALLSKLARGNPRAPGQGAP